MNAAEGIVQLTARCQYLEKINAGLLAACEATKTWIEEAMVDQDDLSEDAKEILSAIIAAIAKAKGEQ